ncbi:MAG: hypothetical protein CK552_02755 [Actinobacteria bacterium]|nr:MAG: hypothetical protein CK552_02755 [Actinomycetota bacterium]
MSPPVSPKVSGWRWAGSSATEHSYVRYALGGSATFGEVIAEARSRGVVAIGYQCAAAAGQPGFLADSLRLNTPKGEVTNFNPDDQVIIVAQRGA